ncbi:PQQ-binding-like beta-propeller repeat protein [Aquimarina sp. TRL1]|uniref:outer membrane protein assembly factor BamB family protein n=1 Tax=Aquimarina sp. (strain TRL1) TaxID=2736252 RepID=UPI00158DDDAE|nr:PQQ-binding-like beta-propeller repeat protein [Aquimarina sp. TRL1]QKX06154.1 PQQ-binding-like beta-propeller repeat protein [Aquimarina sp. TRL1]
MMKLLNSIDIIDVAFNEVNDSNHVYFRMDSTILAIEKLSGILLWEHEIEYSSPIGTHSIWVTDAYVIYGAVDISTKKQILGVLDKEGELLKVIETPYRIYSDGIHPKRKFHLEFLSISIENNKNYYCRLNLALLEISETIELDNLVDTVFIEEDMIFLSGADGVFLLTDNETKKVYDKSIIRVINSKNSNWLIEESNKSKMISIKKWNSTSDLLLSFDAEELKKVTWQCKTIFDNNLFVVVEDIPGISCYNLKTGSLSWEFGKNSFMINSYTVAEGKVYMIAQDPELETHVYVLDSLNGDLIEKIESNVEPEYITFIEESLYISGLLGIEIYK